MSTLEIIEALSEIVGQQNIIIRRQAEALEQMGAVCMEEERKQVNRLVEYYLGKMEEK